MSQQSYLKPVDGESGSEPPSSSDARTRAQGRSRPDRPLPTDRIRFANQEQILVEVASLSGNNRRGVTAEEMSAAIGLKGGTGGLNSRFFRSAHWFDSVGRGEYTASPGLLSYMQHINVDPTARFEAAGEMRAEVSTSWFWEALEPLLANGRPIKQTVALLTLAKASGAMQHTVQLETVLDWLNWVGLIVRDGEAITLRNLPNSPQVDDSEAQGDRAPMRSDADASAETIDASSPAWVEDVPADARRVGALLEFNMSVRITADDARSLSEDQMQFLMDFAQKLRG